MPLLLAAALLAGAGAAPLQPPPAPAPPPPPACAFPIDMNGTEVWGLVAAPGASTPGACAAACCANATCAVWQWCAPGGACAPAGSCWVGAMGGQVGSVAGWVSARRAAPPAALVIDASAPVPPPAPVPGAMPPVARPDGSTLGVTTGGFTRDGAPFFAVAGEMHFTRVPPAGWAPTLRALKAGGLTTVSSYVFMVHHNEVEGVYDWAGGRNLTAFLLASADAGLLVSLRIGPYAHGEARGGGLPDWLQAVPGIALRTNTPLFMGYAAGWYAAVAAQLRGLMWQEGGPVLSVQLDNESGDSGYLNALRAAAVAAGIAPPFFAATGLNAGAQGMLPLAGMYPVEFWDGPSNATASPDYLFTPPDFDGSGFPTLWCELGGGIAAVYCNRHRIAPMDIVAAAYVAAARSNDVGYYMFVGGTNPLGALSSLQERQAFYNGIWELPVGSYDFVAPIGASGAPHLHFHALRALHALLGDAALGRWLAPTATVLPAGLPAGATDADTLRWSARSDGNGSALLFFSTYVRGLPMSPQRGARVTVRLPGGVSLLVPDAASPAVDLPVGAAWAWPVYPPLPGGLRMAYALAQPAGTLQAPGGPVVLLLAQPGVPPELRFDDAGALGVLVCGGACSVEGGALFARGLPPGRGAALALRAPDGATVVTFVVLPPEDAGRLYVGRVAGEVRAVLLTPAEAPRPGDDDGALLELDADAGAPAGVGTLGVRARGAVALALLPPPSRLALTPGGAALPPTPDGVFTSFALPAPPPCGVAVAVAQTGAGAEPPPAPVGARGYPTAPGNDGTLSGAWSAAAAFSLALTAPAPPASNVDVSLRFNWTGDVARLYASPDPHAPLAALVGDAFFNAADTPNTLWTVSLSRSVPGGLALPATLTLRVLPLRADADAVVGLDAWPPFGTGPNGTALALDGVEVLCTTTTVLHAVA